MNRWILSTLLVVCAGASAALATPPPAAPLTDNAGLCFLLSSPDVATSLARAVGRGELALTKVDTHQMGRVPMFRFHFTTKKNASLYKYVCFDVHTGPTPNDGGLVVTDVTPLFEEH